MESLLEHLLTRGRRALATWIAGAALLGCSAPPNAAPLAAGDDEATTNDDRTSSARADGRCEDWATIDCGIELETHGGLIDCARGVRLCQDGRYGPCIADASLGVVSVQAPEATLPDDVHQGLMAVGGVSTRCSDNPCNPYCQTYVDTAPTPYQAPRLDTPTGDLSGGSLQSSNLPSSFKNKGSLDAQCSSAVGSQAYNEACQFDQHCVGGACTAFEPGESGNCTGVDITAPTTCVPSSGETRALTVCNRGSETAPAGIKCYGYPGGSPQYPNSDPGLSNKLLMTTQGSLAAGECETQQIDENIFGQNGIQSVACNPPEISTTTSTLTAYPSSNATTSGSLPWLNPERGYSADGSDATATPANPSGASTGSVYPTANASFQADAPWDEPTKAYSASPAGSYASVSPAAPSGGAGTLGPNYPATFTNPASAGDGSFANPERISAADGSYLTAAPPNPTTVTTLTRPPNANDGGTGWHNVTNAYASDGAYAVSNLAAPGTYDLVLSGFGFNLPSSAVIDEVDLKVKWKLDVNSTKYALTAQALTGAGNSLIGSVTKSASATTESTDVVAVTSGLSARTSSDFSDANFKVRLRFSRSNGNVTAATASVDSVQVSVKYHLSSTQASVVYQSVGLGSIPGAASVQLKAEVKWKTSALNNNLTLGMQLYKNWGAPTPTAIGSEVTRTPAAANTDYVDSTPALTPAPSDLTDSSFAIRLRATRAAGATNPDFTASIDYVRVTVSWSLNGATTTHSIFLKGFGLEQLIPSGATITSVTSTASWKLSTAGTAGTLGLQAYTGGGSTALGTETVDGTSPTSFSSVTQTVVGGIGLSDLSDANFGVRVRVSRAASGTAPAFTAYLDEVHVVVNWTSPTIEHGVTYGNFGVAEGLPSDATITGIRTEARWKNSVSNRNAELAFQAFSGGVALGAEYVDSNPSTSMTTASQNLSGLSLTRSDLTNAKFTVKVRSTRVAGNNNSDYTSDLDYVRVTVTYTQTDTISVDECNVSNNWTASKLVPSPDACQDMSKPQYQPFTVTRVFQGVCGQGQKPTWRRFGYATSTPGSASIEFRFRSFAAAAGGGCTALPAITSGSPAPLATASATRDPPICSTTDPSCVRDLNRYLGGLPGAGRFCLQMDAYGIPDSSSTPELDAWTVLYDCTDAE